MKPEIQGKMMVAMMVSIVAFGFGTGTILVTGQLPNLDSTNMFNNTTNSDLPVIYDTNQNNVDTSDTPSTQEPQTTTPSTPTGDGQTDGQDNQNDNPPSSNNTNTTD